ncbi:cysteine hydrolase family protein [Brenneria uluponensis]|uniref:cysteine hydrolase family protein n=1 Tax=Brenneria uluponensis TaxID=3057057 RepID=UPI0028EAB8C9|nr:isochorismatase family cysteine hydrolase [Brenneria ulupoensis]
MNTIIIALDYIVDIMHPDGKIARSARHAFERNVVEKANSALEIARSKRWPVVLVKVGFSPSYIEQPKHSPMFGRVHEFGALNLDGPGTAFHPDLHVEPSDLVLIKPRVSAFYGTVLEAVLRSKAIDRIVLAGVSSTWAVQSTARDAHDRDYSVVVVEDACAANSEEEHQESMKVLATIAEIVSVADLKDL